MKIDRGQGSVPLERPQQDAVQQARGKGVRAGHLAGGNLKISREGGAGAHTGIVNLGIPKPILSAPDKDPTWASYQDAMGVLNQLVAGQGGKLSDVANQLKHASSPSHMLPAGNGGKDVSVVNTDKGFAGVVDGKGFSANVKDRTMSLNVGNQQVKFSFNENNKLSATANGVPLEVGNNEVGTMNHFFMLMSLFHEMGVEQRQTSRQARNIANKSVVEKIKAQAQEQKSAAAMKLVAGCVSASVKVTSACLTMAGSMKGLKADQAAAQAGSTAHPGDMISQQWSSFGKVFEGMGEAGASGLQYKAALHEARSTELRAEEEQARFVKQTEQDQMQVAQELSSKARDTFSQTWSQYLQTQQNITRNI